MTEKQARCGFRSPVAAALSLLFMGLYVSRNFVLFGNQFNYFTAAAANQLTLSTVDEQSYTQNATAAPRVVAETEAPQVAQTAYHPEMLKVLESVDTRYYVYEDEAIDQPASGCCKIPTDREAGAETLVYSALKAHPLRTKDPDEASLFVIPLGLLSVQWGTRNETRKGEIYAKAFQTLFASEIFQKHQGNRHIIVAPHWYHFEFEQKKSNLQKWNAEPMHQYYNRIWNVTWAGAVDRHNMGELFTKNAHPDYQGSFRWARFQMSRSVFSIGLLPEKTLPLGQLTYERFNSSKYFLFYHTRKEPCWTPHSTEFREAPLKKHVVDNLPFSSIGQGMMSAQQWLEEFTDSKFCLVMRGDNPQTHALNRALKAGCIPILVSDVFQGYAPTLKSSIEIKDYCFQVPEKDFIANPLRELKKLASLSRDGIEAKMKGMAWAQRVILPDHPQSLFVPAFLREALRAQEQARPETTLQEYIDKFGLPS